jgi:hypothetical protein
LENIKKLLKRKFGSRKFLTKLGSVELKLGVLENMKRYFIRKFG